MTKDLTTGNAQAPGLKSSPTGAIQGLALDLHIKRWLKAGQLAKQPYPQRTKTAILTYAYLLAFYTWGYEYILRKDLDDVRTQFHDPDGKHTRWLDHVRVVPPETSTPIV